MHNCGTCPQHCDFLWRSKTYIISTLKLKPTFFSIDMITKNALILFSRSQSIAHSCCSRSNWTCWRQLCSDNSWPIRIPRPHRARNSNRIKVRRFNIWFIHKLIIYKYIYVITYNHHDHNNMLFVLISAHGLGTAALSAKEPEALPFCAIAYALTGIFGSIICSLPAVRQSLLAIIGWKIKKQKQKQKTKHIWYYFFNLFFIIKCCIICMH